MKQPELLAPAGDQSMLAAAIKAGADAVYFGVKSLNMRATAKNFELSQLKNVVQQCHKNKVKAYLTLNTIVYEDELSKVKTILAAAKKAGVDAIICWDLSVISAARQLALPIHLSTQASVSNSEAAKLYKSLGVERFVLARECSLEQVKNLAKQFEVEVFCHGAMCVSESGRCFMSQFTQGCSANRGNCLQPCHRRYEVRDIEEDYKLVLNEGYVMSPKDLCTIEFIDKLIGAGASALKIEGRAKSADYVHHVVSVYREAIDAVCGGKRLKTKAWLKRLDSVYNRGFSSGFYLRRPINEWSRAYGPVSGVKKEYVGVVTNYFAKVKVAEVRIEEPLSIGDRVRFIGRGGVVECKVKSMERDVGKPVKSISRGLVGVKVPERVRVGDKCFLLVSEV